MQTIPYTRTLALASVEDAHNIGCFVRVFGEDEPRRAHYSRAIQTGGVVIRPCHLVVVDTSRNPLEVVWRIATRGKIVALSDQGDDGHEVTLDLGHQRMTLPLVAARPADEQATPLAIGDEVLLRGSLREETKIVDRIVNGQPAHPERLQTYLAQVVARLDGAPPHA